MITLRKPRLPRTTKPITAPIRHAYTTLKCNLDDKKLGHVTLGQHFLKSLSPHFGPCKSSKNCLKRSSNKDHALESSLIINRALVSPFCVEVDYNNHCILWHIRVTIPCSQFEFRPSVSARRQPPRELMDTTG